MLVTAAFCCSLATAFSWAALPAQAASQGVVVVVNDKPITSFDISQRVKLNKLLGQANGSAKAQREQALKELINDIITRSEAERMKVEFKDEQVNNTIEQLAKGAGMSTDGLKSKLSSNGINMETFRRQVETMMVFRFLLRKQHNVNVEISDAEVDRRYAKISSDPRLKPVTVMRIREIDLPVENVSDAMRSQLEYARAVEAQQIMKRYSGCDSAKSAASGIFNVKVGQIVEAPADKLPSEMVKVLKQAGTKRLIGPMRGPSGIRMIGYCGQRTVSPPKPPKEYVKNMLLNERYQKASDRVMRDLRRKAFIDYKDKSAVIN